MTSGTVLKLKVGDKSTALEVNDSTTIDDFVKFCSDAGLNATFDEKQQNFSLVQKTVVQKIHLNCLLMIIQVTVRTL